MTNFKLLYERSLMSSLEACEKNKREFTKEIVMIENLLKKLNITPKTDIRIYKESNYPHEWYATVGAFKESVLVIVYLYGGFQIVKKECKGFYRDGSIRF